ncbi:MAG: hypothetical protein IPG96_00630 [Proteobacteria bacterium]|nr:hypothetical protein [Pseudomonadota bacterium]
MRIHKAGTRRGRWGVLATTVALAALGACGGASNTLEPLGFAQLTLLEFDTRDITMRYTDPGGYAIQTARIRCDLVGFSNGAVLDSRVGVTDFEGKARFTLRVRNATTFKVACTAADAGTKANVPVFISKENGGQLRVQISRNSAAASLVATLRLVENYPCAGFDPLRAPAASALVPSSTKENIALSSSGVEVKFAGLRPATQYSVVGYGQSDGQTVAAGCKDNLSLTQAAIDNNVMLTAVVQLDDWTPEISGNALQITTELSAAPPVLKAVAGLYTRLSDGENDPADELLGRTMDQMTGITGSLVKMYRTQIASLLSAAGDRAGRDQLRRMALALSQVANLQLHSQMQIRDESVSSDGFITGDLSILHTFLRFSAQVGGVSRSYELDAAQRTPRTATLQHIQADRISIGAHTMKLPVASTVVGGLMLETLGSPNLEESLTSMVRCDRLANAVTEILNRNFYVGLFGARSLLDLGAQLLTSSTIAELCTAQVKLMVAEVKYQLDKGLYDAHLFEDLTLQGSAGVLMEPDGKTIKKLGAGEWIGVGTFSGERL